MEIDPRFKAAKKNAARRKTQSWLKPLLIWGGGATVVLGVLGGLFFGGILTISEPPPAQMVEAEDPGAEAAATFASPFIDLAGDPMVLRFDASASGAQKSKKLLRPVDIPPDRAGSELILLTDEMVTGQERLITTLPSSREDFAFFQAQREAPVAPATPAPAPQPQAAPDGALTLAEGDRWGEGASAEDDTGGEDFTKTKVEDTTSIAVVLPEARRQSLFDDVILRLKGPTDLAKLITDNGMDPGAAARFAESTVALLPETATLGLGHIVAIRWSLRSGVKIPVQMSVYTRDSYIGSVALSDVGTVVLSADAWVADDLFSFAGDDVAATTDTSRKYRLLDAFYSGAIRNGVPSAIVSETIVLMSQAYDLEAFAAEGDRMTVLYSRDPGTEGAGPGQVLYAAIKGKDRALECHVFKDPAKNGYSCFGAPGIGGGGGGGGGGDGVALRSGLVTPVKGVLTGRFGPRMHPILKKLMPHNGVDWAAPIGTPVVAAFDGTVAAAAVSSTYGNVVIIDHAGKLQTRYAHLNAFADGIRAGVPVKAGTLIGYIGTTGRSTGPHLHFELYESGQPVDPLGQAGGTEMASSGSAVEQLTDIIIRVESGGNAAAKNPLSSATGLGQFIEGTWIRMMKAYRPDLANTLSREALLALRNDPTLSREMVQNLAREGEAYLRARGHSITAGRLYLCHFLGAEGANTVLKSPDDMLVSDAMGEGVISANPFLRGKTIAYVKNWAEEKMSGHRGGPSIPAAITVPPEVMAYQKIIAGLLAGA